MYDASNRKDVRRAEKDASIRERDRVNYLVAAMSTRQGRVWFLTLLESCHIFSDPFTGDPVREAFLKGERNIGLQIYNDVMRHCPDHFVTMMKEAAVKEVIDGRGDTTAEQPGSEDADGGNQGPDYDPYTRDD